MRGLTRFRPRLTSTPRTTPYELSFYEADAVPLAVRLSLPAEESMGSLGLDKRWSGPRFIIIFINTACFHHRARLLRKRLH